MYYSDGELYIYESNKYEKYTIVSRSTIPGAPSDGAIEDIYFNRTGAVDPGVYKYNGAVWELTNIGEEPGEEDFAYTDNDGQLVLTISAS